MAEVGLRVNEARCLDLADVRWELGRFGKLHVRHGKGARGSGPRERMVPLINGAGRTLRWFVEDVRGLFGDDFARHGAPLLPSERHNADGTAARAGAEALRAGLAAAAAAHLPEWEAALTPHVLRHFCASLREVTAGDVAEAVSALRGHKRHQLLVALRSLTRHCKKNGLIFADPAARIRSAPRPETMILPLAPPGSAPRPTPPPPRPAARARPGRRPRPATRGHPPPRPRRHRPGQPADHHQRAVPPAR